MKRMTRRPTLSIRLLCVVAFSDGKPASTLPENALIRHRHGAQREALAGGQLLGRTLELAAGGKDVASARGAHRRGVAGIDDDLGELLDLLPVRAFVFAARPRIERNQVDLRRNALEQL